MATEIEQGSPQKQGKEDQGGSGPERAATLLNLLRIPRRPGHAVSHKIGNHP